MSAEVEAPRADARRGRRRGRRSRPARPAWLKVRLIQSAKSAVSDGRVDRRHQPAERLLQLVGRRAAASAARARRRTTRRPPARLGGGVLLVVLLGHAVEPVQALGVVRRDAGERRRGPAPVGQQCRAGQRPRSAAGPAERQELARSRGGRARSPTRRRRRRTARAGRGVEPPYPGRESVTSRSPSARAASSSGAYAATADGEPPWKSRPNPSGSPPDQHLDGAAVGAGDVEEVAHWSQKITIRLRAEFLRHSGTRRRPVAESCGGALGET